MTKPTIYLAAFLLSIPIICALWAIAYPTLDRNVMQEYEQTIAGRRAEVLNLHRLYISTEVETSKQAIKATMCKRASELPEDKVIADIVSDCI